MILQVTASALPRGAERFASELQSYLEGVNEKVETVALSPGSGSVHLPITTLGARSRSLPALRTLRRTWDTADVVVAHGSTTLEMSAAASVGKITPFVYRNIGDPRFWSPSPARSAPIRWSMRRAAAVVALFEESRHELIARYGLRADRVRVIPRGVPATRFRPVDPAGRHEARRALGLRAEEPVALYVGSLSFEKNVAVAIEAARRVGSLTLLVIGDGPLRHDLEAQAEGCERIRFEGATADPRPYYAAADLLVLASDTEGIPGVVIEAGLSGLPSVATSVGGVPEVVRDGETGVLVPPRDVDALVRGLETALDAGPAMGAAARAWCLERFSMEVVGPAWQELLDEVRQGAREG